MLSASGSCQRLDTGMGCDCASKLSAASIIECVEVDTVPFRSSLLSTPITSAEISVFKEANTVASSEQLKRQRDEADEAHTSHKDGNNEVENKGNETEIPGFSETHNMNVT
jgi:hypothetical protein